MLTVDLVLRRREPAVRELFAYSVGYPTPEKLDLVLQRYADDPARRLVGFERDGSLDGYVGFELHGASAATIWNIAVQPKARRQGLGRQIVRWLIEVAGIIRLTAETDQHAVGFYRRLGFTVTSLGDERYPGTERFRCDLDAEVVPSQPTHRHEKEGAPWRCSSESPTSRPC